MNEQPEPQTASALREEITGAMFRVLAPDRHLLTPEELRLVDDLATAVLAVILPTGKFLGDQLRDGWAEAAKAQGQIERVRKVLDERRTEVAEQEADGMLPFGTPGASWCDAITVTCARIEDALRIPAESPGVPANNAGPSVAECAANDRRWPLEKAGE